MVHSSPATSTVTSSHIKCDPGMASYLPYEILLMICSLVTGDGLCNLRLVSKMFAHAGLEWLPISDQFFFRKRSLERLQYIAKHPVLGLRLRRITFIVDVVPRFHWPEIWETQAEVIRNGILSARDNEEEDSQEEDPLEAYWSKALKKDATIPPEELNLKRSDREFRELAWRHQKMLRAEQEILLHDLEDTVEVVRRSFAKLSNLEDFRLDTFGNNHCETMRSLYMMEPGQLWYCYNSTCSIESFDIVALGIFNALLESRVLRNGPSIKTVPLMNLHIGATDFVNFDQKTLVSLWTKSDILQNIQSIEMVSYELNRILFDLDHKRVSFYEKTDTFMHQVLANAPNLRFLNLSIRTNPLLNIDSVLDGCIWPNLYHLSLQNVEFSFLVAKKFLSLHARSITQIRLKNISLKGDGNQRYLWLDLFKFIQRRLKVKEISLSGNLHEVEHDWFYTQAKVQLNSEYSIRIDHLIPYMICGLKPDYLAGDEEATDAILATLTWADVLIAYE